MRYKLPMRHPHRHTLLWPLLLLGVAGHAGAPTAPQKAPAPLTLAQALAKLPPPAKGVLLAVGADIVTLPADTRPPSADASPTVLANTFGEETQDFGTVTAIAPATRVLLNPSPAAPDLSVDLSPMTATKMLAASLDDAQWKALTSEGGLGLPDLTDDTQKLLFHALFSHGQLWVASQDPAQAKLPKDQRTDTRNLSDQIEGVRVRIKQTAHLYVHDKKGKTIFFSGPPADPTRLHTWRPPHDPPTAQNNVTLRAVVANTPKSSDLPLSDTKFQQTIPLTGAKTVGELVARIAAKTHTELYADPHYALRLLTMLGPASEAPAADVLRALALAVAGTYRQVGPAFVLTDDLEGVGTRRTRLQNWKDGTFSDSMSLQDQAGSVLIKRRLSQARSLPTFGDPLALTPGQMTRFKSSTIDSAIPDEDEHYPYASLTPAQQAQVRKIADAFEDQQATKAADSSEDDSPQQPDPTGAVSLRPNYAVQFLVPAVAEPVDGSVNIPLWMLYWPGTAAAEAIEAEAAAKAGPAAAAPPKLPPAPPLLPLLRSRPRRGILGHPTTPAAVDALVAAMQKVGLNELWLDVFSEGKSRLTDKDAKGTDILTEALRKTQGTDIAVYAHLSLLPWGNTPPQDTWDLSILGENSRAGDIADHDRRHDGDYDAAGRPIAYVPPPVMTSPVSATVKKALADIGRSLAARPGLAGFVWEDAERGDSLGYTPAMRLAFLRAFHADPVDITEQKYSGTDVSLPTFDDAAAEDALTQHWDDARLGANVFLLTQMRQAIPATAGKPVLIKCSDQSPDWLASWDDPRLLPPPLRTLLAGMDYPTDAQVRAVAAKQGRTTYVVVPVRDPANTDALARDLQAALPPPASPKTKAAWDGYVLDFGDPALTDSAHPLSDLVQAATPKP